MFRPMKKLTFVFASLIVAIATIAYAQKKSVRVVYKGPYSATPLSMGDPSGSGDLDGGWSTEASNLNAVHAGYLVTKAWCEMESNSTITGGTLKWWKQTVLSDNTIKWGEVTGAREVILNLGKARWVSTPVVISGGDRIYCQPSAVTESGADGGLSLTIGFKLESY